jgi:hypothetical protein
VPAEVHRFEARDGLLEELGVLADDTEGAQSKRLGVRAGLEKYACLRLDPLVVMEYGESVKTLRKNIDVPRGPTAGRWGLGGQEFGDRTNIPAR